MIRNGAIVAALFLLICIFTGYFVVYRKVLKGQKKITWKVFLWWGSLSILCFHQSTGSSAILSGAALVTVKEVNIA